VSTAKAPRSLQKKESQGKENTKKENHPTRENTTMNLTKRLPLVKRLRTSKKNGNRGKLVKTGVRGICRSGGGTEEESKKAPLKETVSIQNMYTVA